MDDEALRNADGRRKPKAQRSRIRLGLMAATADGEGWRKPKRQVGALPYRRTPDGAIEIALVTSRETRRWIIPKGWPCKGLKSHDCAAREAFEEAGLVGKIKKRPIGSYRYEKRLATGLTVLCDVEVFPLKVKQQQKSWKEKGQRDSRWFSLAEGAAAVTEPDLKALIEAFGPSLADEAEP